MTVHRARSAAAILSLGILACLGDPVGPSTLTVALEGASADTVWLGAPGEALPLVVRLRISDDQGHPIGAASVVWESDGANSRVTAATSRSDATGEASANWVLGTNAAEQQSLQVTVQTAHHQSVMLVRARAVPEVVSQLHIVADTPAVLRLGDTLNLQVNAIDPYGNIFLAPDVVATVDDSIIGAAAGSAIVAGPCRGRATVHVMSHGVATTLPLHVTQYVAAIVPVQDMLVFSSLGAELPVVYEVRDDRGRIVHDTAPDLSVSDTTVARLTGAQLRSVAPGAATVHLALGTAKADVAAIVNQRISSLRLASDTIRFDALRDTTTLYPIARDSLGASVHDPTLVVEVQDGQVAQLNGSRTLRSLTPGNTVVTVRDPVTGLSTSAPVVVQQRVAQVVLAKDSLLFESLNAEQLLAGTALDPLGSAVAGAPIAYSVEDTTIARVDQAGRIRAGANGSTRFRATANGNTVSAAIRVAQRAVRVAVPEDTIHLSALNDTKRITGTALDSLGSPVAGSISNLAVGDTSVADQAESVTVRARANGTTRVTFSIAGVTGSTAVAVKQVAASVTAALIYDKPIVTLPEAARLPVECHAFDHNAFEINSPLTIVRSPRGAVSGSTCAGLAVNRSGLDTLDVTVDTASKKLPVTIAVQANISSLLGDYVNVDSFPAGASPWSPTVWRNPTGQIELFTTAYYQDSSTLGLSRGDLVRYVSDDGLAFRYDGVVLQKDSDACALNGSGIENVAIVPRQDSVGWRMFYAGGTFQCYGWQVFSAVSTDGRTWTKEPGVRLSNGGSAPPAPSESPPYPVGEGMTLDVLPSGELRMIVGTFEHTNPPPQSIWQIAEWRSQDQINWHYVDVVLTTREMPADGQGSVYSPSIVEIAPGLWRMFFTADNRPDPASRSALWTAVSVDRQKWIVEGKIAGDSNSDLYYATVLGNHLYFIRTDVGGSAVLSVATLQMR